jgi:hypothetical protein
MQHILARRIEFLTEELENTRSELQLKARECEELQASRLEGVHLRFIQSHRPFGREPCD